MAQEVQTDLNYKAELNLVEGVGHQEGKVKEHSQVEQAFGYECAVSGSINLLASGGELTPAEKATLSLNSMSGITEFKIVDGGLRIPLTGAYMAHFEFLGGATKFIMTHYLRIDGETIIQQATTSSGTWTSFDKVLNLGRYNVIEYWVDAYYDYTPGYGTSSTAYINMTLKKL